MARSSVLLPDMFEPLTIRTRGPLPPSLTSLRTADASFKSGCPSAVASNSGPSWNTGNGSAGCSYAYVASAASASSSPTTRSHSPTAGPYAACHRSIAAASWLRRSNSRANTAKN